MIRPSIVLALVRRQVLVFTRNPVRMLELFFWPIVQLLVWGFTATYIQQAEPGNDPQFRQFILFLVGAIILWDSLFRSQQGVAMSFLEDVWTRNLLNLFAAPVRMHEYLTASFVVGCMRVVITAAALCVIALTTYSFNLFQFEWTLFLFYGNLMMFGWALGMFSTSLVLRFGHGAESLAWATPFMIQPFACVFYELDVLPPWMQWIASALPPAHIFEGMREILRTGVIDPTKLLTAVVLNLVYFTLASLLFLRMLGIARERGLLVKTASS